MQNKRRTFLQTAGIMTAGSFILPQWACNNAPKEMSENTDTTETPTAEPSIKKFGIQLYTLRDVISDDPKGILKQLAYFGYHQIESYEKDGTMFWGMTNTDFKKYLDDIGLELVSSHCDINKDFEKKAAQAAEIGMKYLLCPSLSPQPNMEFWKKATDQFNACGEICKKNGIRFAYHNHAYSFKAFSGMIPHDFLMDNTDPELVDFQMDIYWVVTGGADPIDYLKKYPNRFRLCHVKDRLKTAPADDHSASCDLGTGMIDFPNVLKAAADNGMQYYIVEQERYDNSTPMQSARTDAEYLKQLVFA